jgi:ubiquinone/menaquinone biosynthesis C-methylase UbiE
MNYISKDGKLPYDDNYFDIVTVLQVLHHVENCKNLIDEIKRVVKPEGYIILREHDLRNNISKEAIDLTHLIYMCTH